MKFWTLSMYRLGWFVTVKKESSLNFKCIKKLNGMYFQLICLLWYVVSLLDTIRLHDLISRTVDAHERVMNLLLDYFHIWVSITMDQGDPLHIVGELCSHFKRSHFHLCQVSFNHISYVFTIYWYRCKADVSTL